MWEGNASLPDSFAGECPAHYIRLFRNDGQVRSGGRVRLAALNLKSLQNFPMELLIFRLFFSYTNKTL